MEYFNSLVAGQDSAGFRDGEFDLASFNDPAGLAFDESGSKLYVADQMNHRIRIIHLDQQNRVETLVGNDQPGKQDGPFNTATFHQPTAVTQLPGDRLAVYDVGTNLLRLVDLGTQTVSTLAGDTPENAIGQIWAMVYRPADDSLYFSEVPNQRVQKLDLKTRKVATVVDRNPLVPYPRALALYQGQLYVADKDLPTLYEIMLDQASVPPTGAPLVAVGKGQNMLSLAGSGDVLYALQAGDTPLASVLPGYAPVSLASAWGFLAETGVAEAEPFFYFDNDHRIGFAPSPKEAHKLYVSFPGNLRNSIVSVKDYNFSQTWTVGPTTDFNYPTVKPPKTYRILVVGDSRLDTAPQVLNKSAPGFVMEPNPLRINNFAKRLEFWLNAEGALKDVDTHYEVLTLGRWNECPFFFSYYEVPTLVEKYDIDQVCMMTNLYFSDYFDKPLTKEGIPAHDDDPKYVLKPMAARAADGVRADFYQRCLKKGLLKKEWKTFPSYLELLRMEDPAMRKDLMEMFDRPFHLFLDKLQKVKTSSGQTPKCFLFYVPWRGLPDNDEVYVSFFQDLSRQNQVPLVDISRSFNALRTCFYPTNQDCCYRHYNADGHQLIAFLLMRALLENKMIPFESMAGSK